MKGDEWLLGMRGLGMVGGSNDKRADKDNDGYMYYLGCGDCFTDVYIYQIVSNSILKICVAYLRSSIH